MKTNDIGGAHLTTDAAECRKQFTTLVETSYPSLMVGVDRDKPMLAGVKVVARNAKFPREIQPDESVIETLQELTQWIRDNVVMG